MLAAVASWAGYTLLGRRVLGAFTPLATTIWAVLFGFTFLAAVSASMGAMQFPSLSSVNSSVALIFLAIGGL